jgi:hypothetical protein
VAHQITPSKGIDFLANPLELLQCLFFWGQFCDVAKVVRKSTARFSQIWLQVKSESQILKTFLLYFWVSRRFFLKIWLNSGIENIPKKKKKPLDFSTNVFLYSQWEKKVFPSPCKLLLLQRAVFLAASLLQLQYLWWLAHNNNTNPVCNFVVNLFSPGDLYWGSSIFRNQLFQVGSVNLSFCLHIWEHCQSSKSHDLLLASLPAMVSGHWVIFNL